MFDIEVIRQDFPILHQVTNGYPLVYLDSAASSQKPSAVIEAVDTYYRCYNANVHRGIYDLSEKASEAYERARKKVARFINAKSWREVIFTRNATESLNLVAYAWGLDNIKAGDTIVTTEMEHHANLIPWQQLAQRTGAKVAYIPVTPQGLLDLEAFDRLLSPSLKLVTFTLMSNVLGTINPAREIIDKAHAVGATVVVDGAQSVPHLPTDVQALDADFLAFSGHKMLAPTGIGILWGKRAILTEMSPFMTGGEMIKRVTFEGAEWNSLPGKFEAGTPAIAQAIGLGYAVDYLKALGMEAVREHEKEITAYALKRLSQIEGLHILGPLDPEIRGGAVTFTLGDIHPHDLASLLNHHNIAIRAGHHCAQPLHEKLGLTATARASFYVYNKLEEVDKLAEALDKSREIFDR
ncbi:MAG: cysteine desulfurase [Phycisphaerae bacterium]|nr:cysteine desulfurase [Phycisphaerae bacterium]NIX30128.1 SufS family cysteine desulfurase [Phycisphaerae bacterium]